MIYENQWFFKIKHERKTQITTCFLDSFYITIWRNWHSVSMKFIDFIDVAFYLSYASDVNDAIEKNERISQCSWCERLRKRTKKKREILFHVVLTNWCSLEIMLNKYVCSLKSQLMYHQNSRKEKDIFDWFVNRFINMYKLYEIDFLDASNVVNEISLTISWKFFTNIIYWIELDFVTVN